MTDSGNDIPDPDNLSIPSSIGTADYDIKIDTTNTTGVSGTTNLASWAAEEMAERMEYELRGAWRAGFDYLHVYDDMGTTTLSRETIEDGLTFTQYVYPSDSERPALLEHDDVVYRYSYDLNSVPDDVLRRAIRGDIDSAEIREMVQQ